MDSDSVLATEQNSGEIFVVCEARFERKHPITSSKIKKREIVSLFI